MEENNNLNKYQAQSTTTSTPRAKRAKRDCCLSDIDCDCCDCNCCDCDCCCHCDLDMCGCCECDCCECI